MNSKNCDPKIFTHGQPITIVCSDSVYNIDTWLSKVVEITGIQMDWCESDGFALVLYLSDFDIHNMLMRSIRKCEQELEGQVVKYLVVNEQYTNQRSRKKIAPKCD
jgi:hypothetical protein